MKKSKRKKKAKWKQSEGKKREMLIGRVKNKSRLAEYRSDFITSGLATNLECSFSFLLFSLNQEHTVRTLLTGFLSNFQATMFVNRTATSVSAECSSEASPLW